MKKERETAIVILMAIIIMAGILLGTGTVFSGWHLVDDHETVRIAELDVKSGRGFSQVLWQTVRDDMKYRWRPLYWIFRVTSTYLFGLNSVIPNCLLGILGIFTYILLYYSARNIGNSILYSHLFVNIVILGRQFEIWYRISNQENLGLFFFAICLWLITGQFKNHSYHNKFYDFLLTFFIIACAMMKESFLIILPGFLLLRLGMEMAYDEKKAGTVIKEHWLMCLLTLGTFAFSMAAILCYVGTDFGGYAGVDLNSGVKGMIWSLLRMCNNSLKIYLIVAAGCGFCFILSRRNIFKLSKNEQLKAGLLLLFTLYVMAGEMVLYAKSDMWDRYLVPFSVGYGLLLTVEAENLLKSKYLKGIYLMILVLFLGTRLYLSVFSRAASYADEGRKTQKMLSYVAEHTEPDSKIITSLDGGEADMAVGIYLEFEDRKNVYGYEEDADIWYDVYDISGDTGEIKSDDKFDVYILSRRRDNRTIEDRYLSSGSWQKTEFGKWFDVWVNNGAEEK